MDRASLLNDPVEAIQIGLAGLQSGIWTSMPGIVQSVDLTAMTCVVTVAVKAPVTDEAGNTEYVEIYPLLDVPIVFPSGGGFTDTFPVTAGDEVLVVFAARCIDAWWQQGGIQSPMEARMHDLSDAFAFFSPKSQPNVIPGISSTKRVIRNNAGTVFFSVGTKFSMTNATTDLKTVLTNLVNHLKAITTLNSDSTTGAVSAVSQAILTADALAIGALLE